MDWLTAVDFLDPSAVEAAIDTFAAGRPLC
jgi:hypothetical protein